MNSFYLATINPAAEAKAAEIEEMLRRFHGGH
jgi:hypothetical protein